MSVTTEADSQLKQARTNIQAAIKNLNEILVLQCWGHDEYNNDFRAKMRESYAALIKARDDLGG